MSVPPSCAVSRDRPFNNQQTTYHTAARYTVLMQPVTHSSVTLSSLRRQIAECVTAYNAQQADIVIHVGMTAEPLPPVTAPICIATGNITVNTTTPLQSNVTTDRFILQQTRYGREAPT
jgi:hypothetical protein